MGSNLRMLGGGGVEVEVLVEVLVSSKWIDSLVK